MPPRARDKKKPKPVPRPLAQALRPKHLIVDGYNLIHSRPELKKGLQGFGTDFARAELIKAIAVLHDFDGWRITVVWDGRGEAMSVEHPFKAESFGCVFSPGGISADEVIQGLAQNCAARDDLVVATADSGIRVFIQAQGARWLSTGELWRWVDEANASVRRAIAKPR